MLNGKFFFTLVGLIVAVFAICNTNISPAINEGFWGNPTRGVKVFREVHPSNNHCGGYSLQNNYQAMLGNDKFVSTPSFQGLLSPRMSGMVDYGANIRYNMPSYKNQAVPCNPLTFGDMAKEGYKENYGCSKGNCGGGCSPGCGIAKCGKGGVPLGLPGSGGPPIARDPNYVSAMNKVYSQGNQDVGSPLVAVGDMTTIDAAGNTQQPIVYNRFMFANQKSRLRAQGDPIRGDLPIVPCNNGWFNVAVNPNLDLQEGAMNVMGGSMNQTSQALGELIYATSGGADTTIGGVNMANQFQTTLGAAMGDVNVSSFA